MCLVLGIVGAVALFLIREPVSQFAFGNSDQSANIGLLSVILLLGAVTAGQTALLQGMRRIGDLARMNIFSAAAAALLSIPIVYIWGQQGIAAYMVLTAAIGTLVAWRYTRRIRVEQVEVPFRQVTSEATNLLKLGLAFVSTGLMSTGALFLLRVFVTREYGIDGVGQFQAATAISMVYVGFILQAMGTDFYPRLTAVADDNRRCNRLVNEQAEISILLALPGVLATLAIAPWVIQLFYSSKFQIAGEILCWQVAGNFLRVLSWPMGFIILAKGRAAVFFWTDLIAYSVYVTLGCFGLKVFGLVGTGMAFLGLYVFHLCMILLVVRRVAGFAWSPANLHLSLLGGSTVAATLWMRLNLPEPWATAVGCTLAFIAGLYCLRALILLVGTDEINKYTRKLGFTLPSRKASGVPQADPIPSRE